jgi:hypothetical protein
MRIILYDCKNFTLSELLFSGKDLNLLISFLWCISATSQSVNQIIIPQIMKSFTAFDDRSNSFNTFRWNTYGSYWFSSFNRFVFLLGFVIWGERLNLIAIFLAMFISNEDNFFQWFDLANRFFLLKLCLWKISHCQCFFFEAGIFPSPSFEVNFLLFWFNQWTDLQLGSFELRRGVFLWNFHTIFYFFLLQDNKTALFMELSEKMMVLRIGMISDLLLRWFDEWLLEFFGLGKWLSKMVASNGWLVFTDAF